MARRPHRKDGAATVASAPSPAEVEAHLDRVLASTIFQRSERIKRLLSFLVLETLLGRGDRLNEYSIASEVFNRGGSFDPAHDTIVRVEARRLRQKLAEFYEGPGADSPVRIEVARGYKPEFRYRAGKPTDAGRPRRWRTAIAVVAPLSLAALALLATSDVGDEQAARAGNEPDFLTTLRGREEHPSLSPDGSQVAFAWRRENRSDYDVFVQMTNGGEPVALADDPQTEFSPAWSPDGTKIAFVRLESADTARIVVTSPLGGPTRIVAEIAAPKYPLVNSPLLAWMPDCRSLIAPHREAADEPYALYRFDVFEESNSRLTDPPKGIFGGDASPAVSPDGERLAFARQTTIGQAELVVQPLLHAGAEVVAKGPAIAGIDWTPEGASLVASVGARFASARSIG